MSGRRRGRLLASIVGIAGIAGCSTTSYIARAAYEEAKFLWRREPIADLLRDGRVDASRREKLELVLATRAYARDAIGLDVNGSYSAVSEVRGAVVHVLTASRRDRLEPYTWWFPFVGRVPYKGFFSKDEALHAAHELEKEGYDTYVRPAVAFSTLGWFDDPLPSTLLERRRATLANVVFHELFHNTVFVRGRMHFNESAANFVGQRSAIELFCRSELRSEADCVEAKAEWEDTLRISRFLAAALRQLEEFYATKPEGERLREGRERLFGEIRTRARELELTGSRWAGFASAPLNNATLLHDSVYLKELDSFEALYGSRGSMSVVVRELADMVAENDDPFRGLRDLLARPAIEVASEPAAGASAGPE